MDGLKEYRRKRDFKGSPEPAGDKRKSSSGGGHLFVVHKHDAQNLHYDLRLEQDGVLRSWAVPKGPSRKRGDKRLAVEVEDHPLEYAEFEGTIPKDEYGGGTVMLWDRGTWHDDGKDEKNQLDFTLEGEKLSGRWTLTRMRGKAADGGKNWLLIKRSDKGFERKRKSKPIASTQSRSVASNRTMREIAREANGRRQSKDKGKANPTDPSAIKGARKESLPRDPRPQLATLVDEAPGGEDWIHEIKFDGYRILARLKNGNVQLLTRNGKDWRERFATIARAVGELPVKSALLDGEVVALDKDGKSSFRRLQEAISDKQTANLVYEVFDLLYLDGYGLTRARLRERKAALKDLAGAAGSGKQAVVRYSDHQEGQGAAFLKRACEMGLEGIVSKSARSQYRATRTKQWLKSKCSRGGEFLIGGYTDPEGARQGFGSLVLGVYDGDRLIYSGRVGTGFSVRQLKSIHEKLQSRGRKTTPFNDEVPDIKSTHWVRPDIVVEIEYTEKTRDGRLRHPSFKGLREDRDPKKITASVDDRTPGNGNTPSRQKLRAAADKEEAMDFHGIRLTHPDRVLYPEQNVTKLDLARYYEAIQDWLLPHLIERPLSLVRCPAGRQKQCFFQKHPNDAIAERVPRIEIKEKKGKEPYIYVRDLPDVIGLVQAGVLELHPWGCKVDKIEKPDSLIFDLDPGPGLAYPKLIQTAFDLRDRLHELNLTSFARVTGGKGLHIVVPLARRQGWDEVREFAKALAKAHAADGPDYLTTNMSKDKRKGRIFIDYLRNARGATAIASYSTRAREGAPVAVPLRWDELDKDLRPDHYNIANLNRRLSSLASDPWAGFHDERRAITKAMRMAVGLES